MLRFKADDGSEFPAWEEKTLGDVGTVKMCKRVLKEQTSEEGEIPFYKIGTFGGTPDAFISRELYEELKTKYSFPRKGNILLSASGTIGRTVIYDGQDAFFQDSNIVWLDTDSSILDEFLFQFYNKTSWNNLEGGTIKRLYNGLFLSKVIYLPSLPEQKKIAEFLSVIDVVIEKQKETVAAWEERKKGVMQKLFRQEVRFKADDGSMFPEWKKKKFGDTVFIERGGSPRPIEKYITNDEGGFNWIKIGDAPQYGNHITYTEQKIIPEGLKKTRRVYAGDLILSNSMSFGKPYILDIDGCIHDGWLLIRDEKNNYNKMYLCYLLGTEYMLKQYKKFAAGTGVNNLNKELVSNTETLVPCIAEQKKIADCLTSFDDVIEKQKATLVAWEEMKKGLLQQMFV